MSYQVPQHIADSKIFLAKFSEVQGGRLDPVYVYSTKHKRIYNYASKSLNKLVSFATGGTPSKANPEYWNGNIFWVSAKDFKSFYIDSSEDTITELGLKKSSSKLIPQNSLLMVVRSGILLHTLPIAITKCPVAINQDVKALFVKDSQLNAQYLGYFFDVFNKYVLSKIVKHSTTVQSVNTNELERLEIPLPSLEIQKEIVSFMDDAYAQKQQKELQAKALLQSIDEYLLGELGIERPSPTRTENGRFFYTSFHNLIGSEWTPLSIKNMGKRSKSTLYKEIKLSTIATIEKGQSITSKDIVEGEYPVIAGGQSSPYSHNQYNYKGNIITISASGAYSGYVWYHNYPIFASDCSVILSNDENVYLTKYIYEILRLRQQEIYLLQKGAGQPHVYPSDIANLTIPAIPLEKQQKIVAYCQKLRNKAELLQKEGCDIISTAKETIEQMIIGN